MATAVCAVRGDSVLSDFFARERVSSIARWIRTAQLGRRALKVVKRGTIGSWKSFGKWELLKRVCEDEFDSFVCHGW